MIRWFKYFHFFTQKRFPPFLFFPCFSLPQHLLPSPPPTIVATERTDDAQPQHQLEIRRRTQLPATTPMPTYYNRSETITLCIGDAHPPWHQICHKQQATKKIFMAIFGVANLSPWRAVVSDLLQCVSMGLWPLPPRIFMGKIWAK